MFPIHNRREGADILVALEKHSGVFIEDTGLHRLGKATFAAAQTVFASGMELPTPDADSMFPNSVETLPGASRRVIQRYVTRPFQIQAEPLNYLTQILSEETEVLTNWIISHAYHKYGWKDTTFGADILDKKDEWALNIANYPFTPERENQLLFPAHKDWGMMAIYPYIDGPGLEVYINKAWTPLVLPENCLFCYVGECFTKASNLKISSLLHRVKQPALQAGDRTSIIFYADPNRSTVLPNGTVVKDIIESKIKRMAEVAKGKIK